VAFVGREAWVVGFPGIIRHTADSGITWESQQGGAKEALFSVAFADRRRGWIVGRSGLILHTTDGGKTWKRQKSPTRQHLFAVSFLDGKEGWAVGSFGAALHTTDGGQTWAAVKVVLGEPAAPGAAAEPAGRPKETDEQEENFGEGAWGGDDDPYGVDGQDDKKPEEKPDKGGQPAATKPAFDRHLNGVRALGLGKAIAAGESGKIIATADGGATWQERSSGAWVPLYDILFVTPERGFISGGVGTLLQTSDGGASWSQVETGQRAHLFGLALSGDRLHAVGRRGTLLRRTRDRFEVVPLGIYGWLSALAFGADGAGLLVGGQGLILHTTDGGKGWRRVGGR